MPRKSPFPSLGLQVPFRSLAGQPPTLQPLIPASLGTQARQGRHKSLPLLLWDCPCWIRPDKAALPGCAGWTPRAALMASSLGMSWVPSWTHLDLCRDYGAWLWLALTLQTALVRAPNSLQPLRTQPPAALCDPRAAPETTGTRKKVATPALFLLLLYSPCEMPLQELAHGCWFLKEHQRTASNTL